MPPVMIPLSGRVPGRALEPSRSRVDDGGGLGCLLENISSIEGFHVKDKFIVEEVRRDDIGGHQVGRPKHGQGVGHAWGASGGWVPPL